LPLAFFLDMLFGDPAFLPHPVVWMGKLIETTEGVLRKWFAKSHLGERAAGVALVFIVLAATAGFSALAFFLVGFLHPFGLMLLGVFWGFQILATKTLHQESKKVWVALRSGDLPAAQHAVSFLVGRDTQNMTEEEVAKATIETVAENTCDGIVAPMLYLAVGVVPGLLYKAVNTMDSMVGYQNDRYRDFGRAAAKLDDAANFIPARIAACLMILSAGPSGLNTKEAYRIWKRDRRNHKSPNAAQTEAVCAGALGIKLGGDASYFGKRVIKPTIGDSTRPVEIEDILRANRLSLFTAMFCLPVGVAIQAAVGLIAQRGFAL
jgi:adenosylcobinamide-phosphate synthase